MNAVNILSGTSSKISISELSDSTMSQGMKCRLKEENNATDVNTVLFDAVKPVSVIAE